MSGALDLLRRIRRADDLRPGVPGEHWASFGTALALWRMGTRSRSGLLRTAAWIGGALMLARAVSGRDGAVHRLHRRRP